MGGTVSLVMNVPRVERTLVLPDASQESTKWL